MSDMHEGMGIASDHSQFLRISHYLRDLRFV